MEITLEKLKEQIACGYTNKQIASNFNVSLSTITRSLKKFKIVRKNTNFDKEIFVQLCEQGLKDLEIAERLNISKTLVRKTRVSLNIKSCHDKNRDALQIKFKELYEKGLNDSEIGKLLNINHVTIKNWRESLNLPTNFKYSRKFNTDEFLILYKEGKNYKEIAGILGSSESAISEYARSIGLSNNLVNKIVPTYEEEQIILGTLLGDGCLIKQRLNASLNFAHSLAQENYCKWKQSKLFRFGTYGNYKTEHDSRTNKDYQCYYTYFGVATYFTSIYDKFYKSINGIKTKYINKELLYKVDALGLAVWFMDDGYCYDNTYRISTNCFSKEDLDIIQKYFSDKFNIKTSVQSSNVLYIKAESTTTFKSLIAPYIHKDCEYKLNSRTKTPLNRETPEQDNSVLNP